MGEGGLDRVAGMLLQRHRTADAIAILKLNVEEFPKSANAHEDLGEAYEKGGQKELAIASYKKALEIDPKNEDAKTRLSELQKH
jgi:tetratricopeptide (TPR) repeat protein